MKREDCGQGLPVWAISRYGSDWLPAVIINVSQYIRVEFPEEPVGRRRHASRRHEDLEPRDPALNGSDKPTRPPVEHVFEPKVMAVVNGRKQLARSEPSLAPTFCPSLFGGPVE